MPVPSPPVVTTLRAPGPASAQDPGEALRPDDLAAVAEIGTDVGATLRWVHDVAPRLPLPGSGGTGALWSALASVAAVDVAVARMLEPHLDALAILDQVPEPPDLPAVDAGPGSTWGVFAAEGPGVRLDATPADGRWTLTGTKPWCSLAADLTHALVTAWTDDGRRLFAVDLRPASVEPADGPWVPRGLPQVVSAPVRFDGAPAVPVGAAGWYLERPGFAWGGIGVAACWWGGAVGLARTCGTRLGGASPTRSRSPTSARSTSRSPGPAPCSSRPRAPSTPG
ncbi:acyl-CoA dehydrogenase [Cellulosimicrobium sp. CUA-896]|uniref:acyl-CoA dehydrogenase n=1 Tax=Cellulosimicrobium sp. CUA-896 TaxID=1517881 RepID=UPI000ADCB409|nr:acyl-CoA dehydrogenase [Cellulosimicrobium sp. CUA-896]